MAKKLKNIDTFDEHTKKFSLSDVMDMLPTEKEAEQYANGNFGYERGSDEKERAFVSGTDWMRWEVERKLKGDQP